MQRAQGLKPQSFCAFAARLKSCPDTKQKLVADVNLPPRIKISSGLHNSGERRLGCMLK